MKRISLLLAGFAVTLTSLGQEDSTKNESDTIKIGSIIIIKKGGREKDSDNDSVKIYKRRTYNPSNLSTNWWIVDVGISQVNDQTDYAQATAQGYFPAGSNANADWFNQRNIKSTNINFWVFMQRLSLIKHVVNLKYGMGLELNNYRYTENIRFQKTSFPLVIMDSIKYSKNKLAADYVTVPMMLNFNFTPHRKNGFGFSVGGSVGYLYSSRQKTISSQYGKKKDHDDFDLDKWKVSYIGELALGPVRLYGSYATKSMFKKGLDQTPYNIGIRLSNF